ncbi:MAG: hypothetical protein LH610_11895 [Sphingomonas bacterium]|nr:hypothetical protein [Sphingomonas bacterium]
MTDGQWWVARVTFERRNEEQDILPDWAHGGCGWMVALAPNEETARGLLVRDVEYHGLRVIEIDDGREVFGDDEIEEIDDYLAMNFREIEPEKQTVWGTIHCYKGEGEA